MSHLSIKFHKPPTTNKVINSSRTNKYLAANSKKEHTQSVARLVRRLAAEGVIPESLGFKPFILADISYVTTASDIDNLTGCIKFILDGLVLAKFIPNDNLTHIGSTMVFHATKLSKENQRVILHFFESLIDLVSYLSNLNS